MARAQICGAFPDRGDDTAWCELPPGHSGLHEGDAGVFRRHRPRLRLVYIGDGDRVINVSPPRRGSATKDPPHAR